MSSFFFSVAANIFQSRSSSILALKGLARACNACLMSPLVLLILPCMRSQVGRASRDWPSASAFSSLSSNSSVAFCRLRWCFALSSNLLVSDSRIELALTRRASSSSAISLRKRLSRLSTVTSLAVALWPIFSSSTTNLSNSSATLISTAGLGLGLLAACSCSDADELACAADLSSEAILSGDSAASTAVDADESSEGGVVSCTTAVPATVTGSWLANCSSFSSAGASVLSAGA